MWDLDHKESWALKNSCFWTVVLEKTLKSPLDRKEIHSVHPKGNLSWIFIHWEDWCWGWSSNTWWEDLTHSKRPWCWERLKAGEKGDDRGWDGGMASLTCWTWVCISSGSWWWTGRPVLLQSMGLQRVGHWATELNWLSFPFFFSIRWIKTVKIGLSFICDTFLNKIIWFQTKWNEHL